MGYLTVLFGFQIFKDFSAIFLLSISNSIPSWSGNGLGMGEPFNIFFENCLIAQNMIHEGKYSFCT